MKSKFALQLTKLASQLGRNNRALMMAAALGVTLAATPVVQAQTKIGFVSTERILRDSQPAKAAQTKIDSEFKRRDDELQNLANQLDYIICTDKNGNVLKIKNKPSLEIRITDKNNKKTINKPSVTA